MRVIQTMRRACVLASLLTCAMLGAEFSRDVVDLGLATDKGMPVFYFSIGLSQRSAAGDAAHLVATAGPLSVELRVAHYGVTGKLMLADVADPASPAAQSQRF